MRRHLRCSRCTAFFEESIPVSEEVKIMPGLLNARQLFDDHFDPRFFIQKTGSRTYMRGV
jgi:hypothetical protein